MKNMTFGNSWHGPILRVDFHFLATFDDALITAVPSSDTALHSNSARQRVQKAFLGHRRLVRWLKNQSVRLH